MVIAEIQNNGLIYLADSWVKEDFPSGLIGIFYYDEIWYAGFDIDTEKYLIDFENGRNRNKLFVEQIVDRRNGKIRVL